MILRAVAVVALAGLAGCASCPPFKASWYLIEPEPAAPAAAASAPAIYLALLHEGRHEARLTQVLVNPLMPEPSWQQPRLFFSNEPMPQTPLLKSNASGGQVWTPGQLLVFKIMHSAHLDHPAQACSVPVTVQIKCDNGCSKTQAVSGSLPNYLHRGWIQNCQPIKPLPQGGQPQGTP